MLKAIILILSLTLTICGELRGIQSSAKNFKQFNKFVLKYEKKYSSIEEFTARFQTFSANLEKMSSYSLTRKSTHKIGVTKFSDLTPQEFKRTYLNLQISLINQVRSTATLVKIEKKPLEQSSVDWRAKGAVFAVKDQGQCGSCWAFSTIANIEGQHFIKTGKLVGLSEQQLVDCDTAEDQGCNGGLMENAFAYVISKGGVELQSDYKYTATDGTCKFSKKKVAVSISSFKKLDSTDEVDLANFLSSQGPLSIAINAGPLQTYDSGILNPDAYECDPTALDHGVTLVGYGTESKQDYWIIKNSWGTSWGEKGFFRMARGTGACGVNTEVSSSEI